MLTALSEEDVNAFAGLVQERDVLIKRLAESPHPTPGDPGLEGLAQALADQHHLLAETLDGQKRKMKEAIGTFRQVRNAHRSYRMRLMPFGRLNKNLHG